MYCFTLAMAMAFQSAPSMTITVDPGMEVIAISMWLAGKYPPPTDSTYKLEAWNHFRKFKHHPAIEALRGAKQIFTDLTERGLQVSGWPTPTFTEPQKDPWRQHLGDSSYDGFFKGLPDFVEKSHFGAFFQKHRKEYETWTKQFRQLVLKNQIIERLDGFYHYGPTRPRPTFYVYLEPLNSWGAHAITANLPAGSENDVRYQLGFWGSEASALDLPVEFMAANTLGDVAFHEGSHIYVKPLFDRYAVEISKLERLFNKVMLTSQNISTWSYCLNENVVRAITAVLIKQARGDAAYTREVDNQVKQRGFIYTKIIADLIMSEYVDNAAFGTFDDFFPIILKKLDSLPSFDK